MPYVRVGPLHGEHSVSPPSHTTVVMLFVEVSLLCQFHLKQYMRPLSSLRRDRSMNWLLCSSQIRQRQESSCMRWWTSSNGSASKDWRIIPADIVKSRAVTIKDDFTNPDGVEKLYRTDMGVPDTVYCLHDIISHGSEVDFELGLKVNIKLIRLIPQAPVNTAPTDLLL
ncbi:uncharacterized protein ARMOST_14928 [Armillaria ostoyae]|uniref:Uncharacterized protein n=1 Tax=Armillaria ostoyae TaxID=47428 RepID=A0A284RRY9_ARMOS|nr:uncharacterized protein ARMOST_14928 [Armillaria ostoyae]